MSTLDAKVITEPSGAWNAAQSLTSISTTVSTAGEDISSAHNQVASDCTSETTNAALSSLSSQRSTLDALSTNTTMSPVVVASDRHSTSPLPSTTGMPSSADSRVSTLAPAARATSMVASVDPESSTTSSSTSPWSRITPAP